MESWFGIFILRSNDEQLSPDVENPPRLGKAMASSTQYTHVQTHTYTCIHIYTSIHTPYTCTYNSIKYICFYFHLLNKVVNMWIKMTNLKGWRKVNVWELISIKLLAPVLPCIWHRPVSAFPTWRWCGAAIQRPVHCLFMCLRTKPVKLSAPWARVHKEA